MGYQADFNLPLAPRLGPFVVGNPALCCNKTIVTLYSFSELKKGFCCRRLSSCSIIVPDIGVSDLSSSNGEKI